MEFTGGWFLDPFLTGDYPASMRADPTIGQYLPTFSGAEKAALRLGLPFIALNYYTSYYVYSDPTPGVPGLYSSTTTNQAGVDIGPVSGIEWQRVFPQGLKKALLWLHNRYPNSRFWLSEIGCAGPGESTKPLSEVPNDDFRIAFLSDHLNAVYEAIKEGNMLIDAILVWSLMDNWEWQFGYGPRFGVVGVDYTGGTLTRTVKKSALWLKEHFSYMPQKAPLTTSDHHNTTHSGQGVTGTNKKNSAFRVTESRSLLLGLGALCIFYATLF